MAKLGHGWPEYPYIRDRRPPAPATPKLATLSRWRRVRVETRLHATVILHIANWFSLLAAFVAGGFVFKLIDYLILWAKERREQRSQETAHEKDRPRFRVDVTTISHSSASKAIVEILSLGSLPLTIKHGEIFIEASHYPEREQVHRLDSREIGPFSPIKVELWLPLKLINPLSGQKPVVKMKCKFSYGENDEEYSNEKTYNRSNGKFE
jgi:hypothetical protein